jgi:hypothetical protein
MSSKEPILFSRKVEEGKTMNAEEILDGYFYRAKKPVKVEDGGYNDRRVLWVDHNRVQYDSPTIGNGRHYPTIPMEKFLSWVGKEITQEDYMNTTNKPKETTEEK